MVVVGACISCDGKQVAVDDFVRRDVLPPPPCGCDVDIAPTDCYAQLVRERRGVLEVALLSKDACMHVGALATARNINGNVQS